MRSPLTLPPPPKEKKNGTYTKLNTRLPTKKIRKLDVDASREEGKDLSPKFT